MNPCCKAGCSAAPAGRTSFAVLLSKQRVPARDGTKPLRVRAQTRPEEDERSRSATGSRASSRSSSSSATTRGGCTTTSASRSTVRLPVGPFRKGVPLEPGQQHLAVHVEDHPLEYARFEGAIPAGHYGAGSVEIWDHGTFELVEQKRDGGLTVRLHGERLEGTWALVPAHLSGEEKNWLIIRKRDTAAPAQRGERREYKPMLASLAEELPTGRDWLYEVKWDGYRTLARVASERGDPREPQRQGPDDPLRLGREGASARAAHARLRSRRRGLCARRQRTRELLGDAAGQRATRLLRLRPARARGRAARRAPAPRAAARLEALLVPGRHRSVLRELRRREGALRRRSPAGAGGDHGQALGVALLRGEADARLAQAEDAPAAGARRLRLHEGPGAALGDIRRPRARGAARRGSGLRRQLRHGLQRAGDRAAPEEAAPAGAQDLAIRGRAEDAARPQGRRRLGEAGARLRGRVRRMDARRPPARPGLQGTPRRQGGEAGEARAAGRDGAAQREPHAQAVQPGQALLGRRGHHQG